MFRCHLLVTLLLLSVAFADAGQDQPAARDRQGDPLPAGALARMGTLRWRHDGRVGFAAFLPDGKTVLTTAEDETIRVWDFPSGKEVRRIGAPAAEIGFGVNAALTPDGKVLAVQYRSVPQRKAVVRLVDVATGKELRLLDLADVMFTDMQFSPNGEMLTGIATDATVRVWDWVPGKQVRNFGGRLGVGTTRYTRIVYAPQGKGLLTIQFSGLKLWDPATTAELWNAETQPGSEVIACAFAPDGKTLACATASGSITVLDAATGKFIRSISSQPPIAAECLLFSPDGKKLYGRSSMQGAVLEWDYAAGKLLRKMVAGALPASQASGVNPAGVGMALSPAGKTLLLIGLGNAPQFLDLASGKEVAALAGHDAAVLSVQFTPDGKQLVTLDGSATLRHGDARTGQDLGRVNLPDQFAYGASRDGQVVAVLSRATLGFLTMVDAAGGRALGEVELQTRSLPLAFSPDNKVLAVRSPAKASIELYEVPTGQLLRQLPIQVAVSGSSRSNQDDDVFQGGAAGGKKGKGIAGAAKGNGPGGAAGKGVAGKGGKGGVAAAASLSPTEVMIFSPDGKTLAAYSSRHVVGLWDVATGRRVGQLTLTEDQVQSGAFSPDGRCLAVDSGDGIVTLFELATGQARRTFGQMMALPEEGTRVLRHDSRSGPQVAFAPDGKTLAHAGPDRLVHVWDVATGQEMAAFQGHSAAVHAVAFAPDGKSIASASADTTVLLWDMTKLQRPVVKALRRGEELARCWQDLADFQGSVSFTAICDLTATPKEAVALFQAKLKPAPVLDAQRFKDLLVQLNDVRVEIRQQATGAVFDLGECAVPAIDSALANNPPLEVRRRLQEVRGKLTTGHLAGEPLRGLRAVEVLERIGTPEARQLLQTLADGDPGALLTISAQAALKR